MHRDIHDECVGRWRDLLPKLGVNEKYLKDTHGPCPMCNGGKDRFRFDDKGGRGTWICSVCGAGNGVELVMRHRGISFVEATSALRALIPASEVRVDRAKPKITIEAQRTAVEGMWGRSHAVHPQDPVGKYLTKRGIPQEAWSHELRFLPEALYPMQDGNKVFLPAMVARVIAGDGSHISLHKTYLTLDGDPADVPERKMLVRGPKPSRGSVRLSRSAETMGIATGIETSLAASSLAGVPVWAALSDGGLNDWQPPPSVKKLIIYGDNDRSFSGQLAAYGLARRLMSTIHHPDRGHQVEDVEVKIPDFPGWDWNDILNRLNKNPAG